MRVTAPIERDIVLVGGGHAHVDVIKRFGMRPEPGVRLTLIARDSLTPYSGMIPGLLRGVYSHADCHIDLGRICRWAGVGLIRAAATGLDLIGQRVEIAGRPPLAYDLLSIDVGSTPPAAGIAGADEFALPIKPLDRFLDRLDEMDRTLPAGSRLAVAGAGAGGVETALGLKRRFERQGKTVRMTLLSADPTILPGHAESVRARMTRALADAGVEVRTNAAVAAVDAAGATLADGTAVPADIVILATGAAAPAWLAGSGLAVDDGGFVRIDRFLRSPSHPEVFAAGDCAAFDPRRLDKSGVYAVRAGPPLAANLRRAAIGEPQERWTPQRRTLALMSTGDGGAVVSYGRFAASGRWAWTWKDRIDRRWMERYRDLPPMKPEPPSAAELAAPAPMRCGGCGAKVASPILRRALAELGLADAAGDDAAILEPKPGEALVQTVDQFRSFIDDPFLFGEIATVHALGDLYAMGAEPDSALATAILPHAGAAATERDLVQLLAGVLKALDAAGARLVGGHTGEGADLSLGLSLNGYRRRDQLLPKGGGQDGDVLLLTKPLGVGALLAADMRGESATSDVEAAIAGMRLSAAAAADALRAAGARALTDVTGFGLAGHLIEMADGADLSVDLDLGALPALPGALSTIARGVESTMAPANAAFAERFARLPDTLAARLLFDPQTSGGLLAAVPAETATAAVAALKAAGYPEACAIGRFAPAAARAETVRIV